MTETFENHLPETNFTKSNDIFVRSCNFEKWF